MNKKFTLLAAALMTASTFTANAEGTVDADTSVKAEEWTVGNYYYLKSGDVYLALDGNKPDSVIVNLWLMMLPKHLSTPPYGRLLIKKRL